MLSQETFPPSHPIDFYLCSQKDDYAILADGQGRIVHLVPFFVGLPVHTLPMFPSLKCK
jgi:hypothetical protein